MKKKILSLFVLISTICMVLSGCKDSVEREEASNSAEEQGVNDEISKLTEKISNNHETDNQESYAEVDITDLSKQILNFSYGKGWYLDNSSEEWTCIDVDGNILFTLPYGYVPISGFIQNLCLIQREGYKCILIDESGSQVFSDLTTGDSECLMLSENNGKINIWLHIVKDTYDGHSETLQVIDGEGKVISEYVGLNMGHIKHMGEINSKGLELKNLGDGMYQCSRYVFNTNNNSYFLYEDNRGLSEEIRNFENGYGVGEDGKIINSNGVVRFTKPNRTAMGNYREGVYFLGNWEEIYSHGKYHSTFRGAFYNVNGQVELDVSQYTLVNVPFFEDGYCVMNILNEAGVIFTAVMNRNGEFLFEPVEGQRTVKISEEIIVVNGDLIQIYDLEQNTINTLDDDIEWVDAFSGGWAAF